MGFVKGRKTNKNSLGKGGKWEGQKEKRMGWVGRRRVIRRASLETKHMGGKECKKRTEQVAKTKKFFEQQRVSRRQWGREKVEDCRAKKGLRRSARY